MDQLLIWQNREKPRNAINKLVLATNIIIVSIYLAKNKAIKAETISLLSKNIDQKSIRKSWA